MPSLNDPEFVLSCLQRVANDTNEPPQVRIDMLRLHLQVLRMHTLIAGMRATVGDFVLDGPFKGLRLPEGGFNYACHLLGCYEHELHPVVEAAIAKKYRRIANIGCSFGYYAVGFATRIPEARIDAYDIDENARAQCTENARLNGVAPRVALHGLFEGAHFADYVTDGPSLIFMDIEGGEVDLLDPEKFPALKQLDVVVELHDVINPTISRMLAQRFAATHDVQIIANRNALPNLDKLFPPDSFISMYDHATLGWEGRGGPTPWGVFTVKKA